MIEVLVVDDNPQIGKLLDSLLNEKESSGIRFSYVCNKKAAKSYLAKNKIDLIILDLGLKESKGLDSYILMQDIAPDLPIVILTGSDEQLAMEAIKNGAYEYIQKTSLNANMLQRVILQSVERHNLRIKSMVYAQKLEENEQRLRQIINHNVDGILIIDKQGVVQFSNPSADKLLNKKSGTLKGVELGFPLVIGESTELDIAGNPVKRIEMRVAETVWERRKAYLASMRDITERKQAEMELRKSEEKFFAIASSANDAIVHINEKDEIQFWNAAAESMFGYSSKEMLGKKLHSVVAPKKFRKKIQKGFKEFAQTGEGDVVGKLVELEGITKDGKKLPVEVTFSAFQLDGNWHAAGNIRDITERKKNHVELIQTQKNLEEALKELKQNQQHLIEYESLKSIKELSGAISHEFSQPLQALQTYIELIEKMGPQQKYFDKCKKLINRISGLMNELNQLHTIKRKDYLNTKIIDLKASSDDSVYTDKALILIVDDEPDVLEPMVEVFKRSGFNCHGAENGVQALQLVKDNEYRLIISDINMPEMSGPELFEQVRKINFGGYFLFLTGYELPGDKRELIMKADALINKPVLFQELIAIVNKLLGKSNGDGKHEKKSINIESEPWQI